MLSLGVRCVVANRAPWVSPKELGLLRRFTPVQLNSNKYCRTLGVAGVAQTKESPGGVLDRGANAGGSVKNPGHLPE